MDLEWDRPELGTLGLSWDYLACSRIGLNSDGPELIWPEMAPACMGMARRALAQAWIVRGLDWHGAELGWPVLNWDVAELAGLSWPA